MIEGAKVKVFNTKILLKSVNFHFLIYVYQYRHFSLNHILKGIFQLGHVL